MLRIIFWINDCKKETVKEKDKNYNSKRKGLKKMIIRFKKMMISSLAVFLSV